MNYTIENIKRFACYGYLNHRQGLSSLFNKKRNIIDVATQLPVISSLNNFPVSFSKEFIIEKYSGNHPVIRSMIAVLNEGPDIIKCSLVHGSYADNTAIEYSDFDGWLLVSDEVLHNRNKFEHLCSIAHRTTELMFQIDPLQHHSWFITFEHELLNYNELFLPSLVLQHGKLLTGQSGIKLNPDSGIQWQIPFDKMANDLLIKLKRRDFLNNLYSLKSVLSEFMLLPALFQQKINKQSVLKKYSFISTSTFVDQTDWYCMNVISQIRKEWKNEYIKGYFNKNRSNNYLRHVFIKKYGPLVPAEVKNVFTTNFTGDMIRLIDVLKLKSNYLF